MIVAIVEGHSETESVPVLLRRFFVEMQVQTLPIRTLRAKRYQVVKEGQLERYVELARRQGARAILVLLDADDDCPKEVAPSLLRRALDTTGGGILCSVVLPKSEMESWFIAGITSLRGRRGISETAVPPEDPESVRDAKGWLTSAMAGRTYVETDDQPTFAAMFSLEEAAACCRSFRKFDKDVRSILQTLVSKGD
ncbi:MAG: DUF4276 family protein [Chloroflexota bacterium]|nr:DUF4276 family protein [Chloroflexota bacterium]